MMEINYYLLKASAVLSKSPSSRNAQQLYYMFTNVHLIFTSSFVVERNNNSSEVVQKSQYFEAMCSTVSKYEGTGHYIFYIIFLNGNSLGTCSGEGAACPQLIQRNTAFHEWFVGKVPSDHIWKCQVKQKKHTLLSQDTLPCFNHIMGLWNSKRQGNRQHLPNLTLAHGTEFRRSS